MINNSPTSSFTLEQMHAYLTGTASESVTKAIEKQVESDKDLVMVLEEMDIAIEAGSTLEDMISRRDAFFKGIHVHNQRNRESKTKSAQTFPIQKSRFSFLRIAAAVLIFVIGGTFIFNSFQGSEPLIGDYLEPYGNQLTLRTNSIQSDFQDGMDAYDIGDYQVAIDKLALHLQSVPNDAGARLYIGISHLMEGESDLAIKYFDELSNDSDHSFGYALSWYRSLALWQNNQIDSAVLELNNLTIESNPFQEPAEKLLKKLSK